MAIANELTHAGHGTIDALRTRFAHWRARRSVFVQTRNELMRLSDRDLADLGIQRANIQAIAQTAANVG